MSDGSTNECLLMELGISTIPVYYYIIMQGNANENADVLPQEEAAVPNSLPGTEADGLRTTSKF